MHDNDLNSRNAVPIDGSYHHFSVVFVCHEWAILKIDTVYDDGQPLNDLQDVDRMVSINLPSNQPHKTHTHSFSRSQFNFSLSHSSINVRENISRAISSACF